MDLITFIANLPSHPGVYQMLDNEGNILYVGKAANLKKRVSSYFVKNNSSAKTRSLVSQIKTIEISITQSETEALLLESNLIKKLQPKYNVLMRDDKSYPYIYVNHQHPYPRIEMIRSKKKPTRGMYFGPYPSVAAVRETLSTIQKLFKIRNCSENYFKQRSRPCLQFQIKRCSAPCVEMIALADYQQSLQDAIKFLQGKSQLILKELTMRMEVAVANLAYEEAAILRDQIKSLRLVQEQQNMVQLRGDADVIAMTVHAEFAGIQCVSVRDGQIISNQSFFPSLPEALLLSDEDDEEEVLNQQIFEAFVSFYYVDTPERIPPLVILANSIFDRAVIAKLLSELRTKNCKILLKPHGVQKGWVDFARNNLDLAMAKEETSLSSMKARYEALSQFLTYSLPIKRMECFDISHTQGHATVASCVVFNEKGPSKREYRRFNIENITKSDDYAAMEQVLTRRCKWLLNEGILPDIWIIDGGRGQINIARKVLQGFGLEQIMLLGIAKGPTRKAGLERIVLVTEEREMSLPPNSKALHLLQHIRDEAHRFAITTHRKKRQHQSLDSSLETIEGIGPKKRQALLKRFGGLRELERASIHEIAKVEGVSNALATRIFHHFHPI